MGGYLTLISIPLDAVVPSSPLSAAADGDDGEGSCWPGHQVWVAGNGRVVRVHCAAWCDSHLPDVAAVAMAAVRFVLVTTTLSALRLSVC